VKWSAQDLKWSAQDMKWSARHLKIMRCLINLSENVTNDAAIIIENTDGNWIGYEILPSSLSLNFMKFALVFEARVSLFLVLNNIILL
jgi:hypothetical protein